MEAQETVSSSQQQSITSLTARIANVFASPSELWSEVAIQPVQKSSWVVPYVLSLVVVLVFTFSLYNNETLRNQIYDSQREAMQKAVVEGKMTQAQAERAEEQIRSSGPVLFVLFGGVSQIVVVSIMFFGMALVLWLVAKFALNASAGYSKVLEISGLASCIGILGAIVTLLLMYAFDSLYASPGPALAVIDSFDANNTTHKILAQINIFSLWETAVLGLALSKISGKSTGTGMAAALGLWLVWSIIAVALGLGFR